VLIEADYSFPADVWSAGCIAAELAIGKPAFSWSGAEQRDYHTNVGISRQAETVFSILAPPSETAWPGARGARAWKTQYDNYGAGPEEALEFFGRMEGGTRELAKKLLRISPRERLTAEEAEKMAEELRRGLRPQTPAPAAS
jgi:serine/threonine protein kinase